MEDPKSVALEKIEPQAAAIVSRMTVNEIEEQFREYRELQNRLDKLMPDQIMEIGSGKSRKKFRKKGYWRAIKKWAGLSVEIVDITSIEEEYRLGSQVMRDWGYTVRVRVTAPTGQYEEGDGTCMCSEKYVWERDWDEWRKKGSKGPPPIKKDSDGRPILDEFETLKNATKHNIIGHATTRAKNRAISDMSGFGEVSAEEVNTDGRQFDSRENRQRDAQHKADQQGRVNEWTKALWVRVEKAGMDANEWSRLAKEHHIQLRGEISISNQKAFTAEIEKFISHAAARDMGKSESPEEIPDKMFASESTLDILWKTLQSLGLGKTEAEMIDFVKKHLELDDLNALENLTEAEAHDVLTHIDEHSHGG